MGVGERRNLDKEIDVKGASQFIQQQSHHSIQILPILLGCTLFLLS